ncbi:37S ribosomal protein S24, mitochondrial [Ptychographa xylographoides]|nr:37S ribosomal protein S24, mitochondrial [Ptychographa xylographoides]
MVSAIHTLRLTALRSTYRFRPRRTILERPRLFPLPTFHTTTRYNARDPDDNNDDYDYDDEETPLEPASISFVDSLTPESRAFYDSLSPADRLSYEADAQKLDEYMKSERVARLMNAEISLAANDVLKDTSPDESMEASNERFKSGFMSMGEDDEIDSGEDETFEGDDISSIAHGELEQHRELREYARVTAWEMPLLSKLTTPFQPPTHNTPLRFRATTYLGETHPAALKIVLEFSTIDLPLLPAERLTLIKLLGVRYDPRTDVAKLSCEMFESQAQNKRYLGDLVDTLMQEAREGGDKFDDIPVDLRHVKWKPKLTFPDAWKLGDAGRREQLQNRWAERERLEAQRQLVDGARIIEEAVSRVPEPEMVTIPAPRRTKPGGTTRRRLL